MSDSESDPRKVVQLHSSLRTSAKASVSVGRDLSYQAARRMVREPSCAICRWAKSVTREKRLNSAPLSAIPLCNYHEAPLRTRSSQGRHHFKRAAIRRVAQGQQGGSGIRLAPRLSTESGSKTKRAARRTGRTNKPGPAILCTHGHQAAMLNVRSFAAKEYA